MERFAVVRAEVVKQIALATDILSAIETAYRSPHSGLSKAELRSMQRDTRQCLAELNEYLRCLVERN